MGAFFSTNLIDLDLHRFVRRVQSSPVKKNAPYHFGIADLRLAVSLIKHSGNLMDNNVCTTSINIISDNYAPNKMM